MPTFARPCWGRLWYARAHARTPTHPPPQVCILLAKHSHRQAREAMNQGADEMKLIELMERITRSERGRARGGRRAAHTARREPSWRRPSPPPPLLAAWRPEGEWLTQLDLVEKGDHLMVTEMGEVRATRAQGERKWQLGRRWARGRQPPHHRLPAHAHRRSPQEGDCGVECKTAQRAAEDVLGEHDTDVAEALYRGRYNTEGLAQWLCMELRCVGWGGAGGVGRAGRAIALRVGCATASMQPAAAGRAAAAPGICALKAPPRHAARRHPLPARSDACKTVPPPLPKDRAPGPPFKPASQGDGIDRMLGQMEETGMRGSLYSRDQLLEQFKEMGEGELMQTEGWVGVWRGHRGAAIVGLPTTLGAPPSLLARQTLSRAQALRRKPPRPSSSLGALPPPRERC